MMKRKLSVVALSLVTGAALITLAADSPAPKPTETEAVHELRAQVTELRAEIEKLRQRTQTLESNVEELKRSRTPSPLNFQVNPAMPSTPKRLIPSPGATRPPTVWGQGEVNGWTFYIVPCEERSH
jgi:uncharacterized coiled-coil protein SlyX